VTDGDIDEVSRRLARNPALATTTADVGATRQESVPFFFTNISHYLYAGDTALHMAAAGFQRSVAQLLVEGGADCRARNRRGAEPLHYAADANRWDPVVQSETIAYLISVGADPNARDRSGVAPLHRAVRTRSFQAVRALVDGGADPELPNTSGSTPLHLAVQSTGRGGSGSSEACEEQASIIGFLLERGARVTSHDGRGRDVYQTASTGALKVLSRLANPPSRPHELDP
jgi:ankyrin repeat protein